MNISEAIGSIARPLASYYYARNADFNIQGDVQASPCIVCIEPDQQYLYLDTVSGNLTDGYNLFIRFITRIDPVTSEPIEVGEQANKRLPAINEMKLLAAQFINDISESDLFVDILPQRIPITTVIEAYDGNWFGVEINLTNLQTIYPFSIC